MSADATSGRLSITYRTVDSLRSNPRNARTHSKRQLRQIAASIRAFGFINPIVVDDDGMVLAGHGRLQAAALVGLDSVPTVQASGLNEAQRREAAPIWWTVGGLDN